MNRMIAALFVQTNGAYFGIPDVEPWDEKRDARKYDGPHPVVAHPPCHLWVNLACVNFKRYGGEHNRPGNDGGCFASALRSVRAFGGVIEHPASSRAWSEFGIDRPKVAYRWNMCGRLNEWTCEIWQSAYGHKARKRTWLLYVGARPLPMRWERKAGTHQIGWFDREKPTLGKKEASATPAAFRNALLALARSAVK
jgi:hypothetical protein